MCEVRAGDITERGLECREGKERVGRREEDIAGRGAWVGGGRGADIISLQPLGDQTVGR